MKLYTLKYFASILLFVSATLILISCDEKTEKNNQTNDSETIKDTIIVQDIEIVKDIVSEQVKLIDIPAIIKEETKRSEIDSVLITIDVFASNSAQNEQVNLLNKLFPGAVITTAEASEVFDSHNIVFNEKEYCAVVLYEQNDQEEFVIHSIFITEGLFSFDITEKIFS